MAVHQCPHCNYWSEKTTNVSRHCARKHDNNYLNSQIGYGVKEMNINHPSKENTIPQYHPRGAPTSTFQSHVPHIQHSNKASTSQQYHSRALPQYNEVWQHVAPTTKQYTVTHNPQNFCEADDEMDTDDESEVDHETDNESEIDEVDIFEILSDISLSFDHLRE